MSVLLLVLTALGGAYLANKYFLQMLGERSIYMAAPLLEEIVKTMPAYFYDRSIFLVHLFFGLGEALYDFFSSRKTTGKWAALFSILSHSLFGGITVWVLQISNRIILGISAAIFVHGIWNYSIMRAGRGKKQK